MTLTGDTQTDTINRAIQVYARVERLFRLGAKIYSRWPLPDKPAWRKFVNGMAGIHYTERPFDYD